MLSPWKAMSWKQLCLEWPSIWSWLLKWTVPAVCELLRRFPVTSLNMPAEVDRSQAVVLSRRLRRWLEQNVEPFLDETHSHRARLVSSVLSSCCLPAVVASAEGSQLVRSVARVVSEGDIDKLTQLERELNRISLKTESADGAAQLHLLSLMDHVLMLGHYRLPCEAATPCAGWCQLDPLAARLSFRPDRSPGSSLIWLTAGCW